MQVCNTLGENKMKLVPQEHVFEDHQPEVQ